MYPFIRLLKDVYKFRNAPPLEVTGTHVSTHICWPWDIDLWMELNNGRTLTLYDLSRIPLAGRTGLIRVLKQQKWGLTMAGASVRYRRRVRMFDRFEIRSRVLCWDERFIYIEQSMWRKGEATSHILYRSAVTDQNGIVPVARVAELIAPDMTPPDVPAWVAAWIEAESLRPWPPIVNENKLK
jgi:acyl-CoA thioesterase FadM